MLTKSELEISPTYLSMFEGPKTKLKKSGEDLVWGKVWRFLLGVKKPNNFPFFWKNQSS